MRMVVVVTAAVVGGLVVLVGLAFVLAIGYTLVVGEKEAKCSFYSGFATGDEYGLTWSRTGTEIAFGHAHGSPPDIHTVELEAWPRGLPKPLSLVASGGARRLGNGNCASAFPSWSPDGRRIAYAGNDGAHARYDVWVMNADGSGARFVAHGRGSGTG